MSLMDDILVRHQRARRRIEAMYARWAATTAVITSTQNRLLGSRRTLLPWQQRCIAGGSADRPLEEDVQARVRALIEAGVLPRDTSKTLWVGKGSGAICPVCQQPITADAYEFDLGDVLLHRDCHRAWQREVRAC
jgi:hypothetical protein